MDNKPIFLVLRNYKEGEDSIVGAYASEYMAKEVFRVLDGARSDTSFSLVAVLVQVMYVAKDSKDE